MFNYLPSGHLFIDLNAYTVMGIQYSKFAYWQFALL